MLNPTPQGVIRCKRLPPQRNPQKRGEQGHAHGPSYRSRACQRKGEGEPHHPMSRGSTLQGDQGIKSEGARMPPLGKRKPGQKTIHFFSEGTEDTVFQAAFFATNTRELMKVKMLGKWKKKSVPGDPNPPVSARGGVQITSLLKGLV